jgi:electron-transferring-flavoprotein dehydrogenase
MGVDILPGIAGDNIIYNGDGSVGGVITGDFGIAKDGSQKSTFQAGIEIKARQTIFTEGCRGSLTQRIKQKFNLEKDCIQVQHYGIGLKEVWRVAEGNPYFSPGKVQHTVHWPLPTDVYGGSFLYHMAPDLIHVGLVVGLDYENPYLNPYELFQQYKTHPEIKKVLQGGECLSYGARALNEGGYHAIPKLSFPGGMLAGDSAGFLNVSKIKGAHNAIKSGMVAAESIYDEVTQGGEIAGKDLVNYEKNIRSSWIVKELKESRNFKGGFDRGLWAGLLHGKVITMTKGREPWTLRHKVKDSDSTKPKEHYQPIEYPKKDGKLTFDLLTNLARSGTNHDHDQPSHLRIKKGMEKVPVEQSLAVYDGPEQRFCPAKVYEYITDENTKEAKLQINAQNCLHCKCCSIKTPKEFIDWNVPEGGGGPAYSGM